MRARALRLALGLLLTGCAGESEPLVILNRCTGDDACRAPDRCDLSLGICVRENTEEPYPLLLRISPGEGSASLSPRTLAQPLLTDALSLPPTVLSAAVLVTGRVLKAGDDTSTAGGREAELVFTPKGASMQQAERPASVITQRTNENGLAFRATLEPDTTYEVRVLPLGSDSTQLPPRTFTLTTGSSGAMHDFVYDALASFPGALRDESGRLQKGRKLRMRAQRTGEVVSSLGTVGEDGRFELFVAPSVLEELLDHDLEIGLEQTYAAFGVTMTVDGSRLHPGSAVVVPAIPEPVLFIGRVEVDANTGVRSADVTFSSSFDRPGAPSLYDWCRARTGGSASQPFRCRADLRVSVGPEATVRVKLYPGFYSLYITPNTADSPGAPRLATTAVPNVLGVQAQPDGGAQAGEALTVKHAVPYRGYVTDNGGRRMPSIQVTARALGLVGDLDRVAAFNRSTEALSDSRGNFELPVDTGYYDVLGIPPEGSGYAWTCWPNRRVPEEGAKLFELKLRAPVTVRGTVVGDDGRAVPGARVEAFAIVKQLLGDTTRALSIGQATSSDAGVFVLHLPPRIGEPPEPEDGGTPDAGRDAGGGGLDAGLGDLDAGLE